MGSRSNQRQKMANTSGNAALIVSIFPATVYRFVKIQIFCEDDFLEVIDVLVFGAIIIIRDVCTFLHFSPIHMAAKNYSRRSFLTNSLAGGIALPLLIPQGVLSAPNRPGANETVRAAIIGLGGRGNWIYSNSVKPAAGIKVVAVSEVFRPKLDAFMKRTGDADGIKGYDEYREMFDREKLDGVFVETTTHARARAAILAMQAGLHTYIEKPMSLTIAEGRYMCDAAKKYGVVVQVGSQQRSLPLTTFACQQIKAGAIGKVKIIQAPNFVGPSKWERSEEQPLPAGGKENWWDRWQDQAVSRPFHASLFYDWSRWWDYDGGGLCFGVTGWGTHSFDQVNAAIGADDFGPTEIILEESPRIEASGKFAPPKYSENETEEDDTGKEYYGMANVTGPRAKIKMKFANGVELRLHLDGDRGPGLGCIVTGEKGKIEINRHKLSANPKELIKDAPPNSRDESVYHVENWIDGIKTGKKCNCDIETGHRGTTLCYLVNIAHEVGSVGKPLLWDSKAEKFTNSPDGNKLLSREQRKGYELPKIS